MAESVMLNKHICLRLFLCITVMKIRGEKVLRFYVRIQKGKMFCVTGYCRSY